MICVLALLLAVAVRLAGPLPPPYRSDIEYRLRRYVAAELDDRSWRNRQYRQVAVARRMDRVAAELHDPVLRACRAVHTRLDQPTWTGLVKPAKPHAVWPTYMGQPYRVRGATLVDLIGVAA